MINEMKIRIELKPVNMPKPAPVLVESLNWKKFEIIGIGDVNFDAHILVNWSRRMTAPAVIGMR